jgi:hypothetical protein
MSSQSDQILKRRERVLVSYREAELINSELFDNGDDKATSEYIFPNQKKDANNIVDKFYKNKRRVISIQKKTKVGADGLMIEIAKLLTTHSDDKFVVNPANVRILTGMSNAGWEKDMIDKAPNCFKDKIFHHGKLSKADLKSIRDGLIIIDEIDTGDKEYQVLHNTLKEAGILDVKHMEEHNNRFVFISATLIKELYDLYRWGDLHELYKMTIPSSYFGHKDFLEKGIVKEFFSVNTSEAAEKWVQEDILDYYKNPCICKKCNPEKNPTKQDFRVHLVRVTSKNVNVVQNACIRKGVQFRNHTSADRLSEEEIKEFFKEPLTQHIVLGVKGFFRRANLIPNRWKLRIGAMLELYTKVVDNNVQIQGLVGRMTGYWRDDIEGGHKTGPHRTSIKAIEEYEKAYLDPFGTNSYQSAGFKKKEGKVSADPTMLSSKNIKHLEAVDLPVVEDKTDPTSIPILISVSLEDFKKITKSGRSWNIDSILNIIKKYSNHTYEKIKNMEKNQVVQPETDASYDKLITAFVNASEKNIKYTWAIGDKKTSDTYQIYLDNRSNRIIISIYYGSKIVTT